MSFSQNVKEAICQDTIRANCCKKAFLAGVLLARGELQGDTVFIRIADKIVLSYVVQLVEEIFAKTPDIRPIPFGGRNRAVVFTAKSALRIMEDIEDGNIDGVLIEKCSLCKTKFLQGLFVSSGRVSDPAKQNFLEFSVYDRADLVEEILWKYEMQPRRYDRRNEKLLQIKDGEAIEDFFGLLGMNQFYFLVADAHMESMVKSEVQRQFNCDTMNIQRAVLAASRQTELLEKLKERGLLEALPADLHTTALARLANPHLPLSQLAENFDPPLKKSCLAQRLRKIEQLARDLMEDA